MNRKEIRNVVYRLIDDEDGKVELAPSVVNGMIDEAAKEACIRSDLIIDSTTPAYCELSVTIGQNSYSIHPMVIDILRVKLPSVRKPIEKTGYKRLDDLDPEWETKDGSPYAYVLDKEKDKLIFSRKPIVNETAVMTVSREPILLANDNAEPEFHARYHYDLVWWVLHLIYSVRDQDWHDPDAAQKAEIRFTQFFGPRKTAGQIESRRRGYGRRSRARFV